jgi:hypothetical protein
LPSSDEFIGSWGKIPAKIKEDFRALLLLLIIIIIIIILDFIIRAGNKVITKVIKGRIEIYMK